MLRTVIKHLGNITQRSLIGFFLILGGCQSRSPLPETANIEPTFKGVPVEVQPTVQPIEQSKTTYRLMPQPISSNPEERKPVNQLELSEEVTDFKLFLGQIEDQLTTHLFDTENDLSFELSETINQCQMSQPSLYHQMGHLIDQQFNQLSQQESFKAHIQEGVDLLFSLTPIENPSESEAFAQGFQFFFEDPEKLLQYEELYKYFCTLIEQLQTH